LVNADHRSPGEGALAERSETVLETVRSLVSELRPHRAPEVTLDSDLERDLGLDSLAVAELLVRLEDAFAVSLPDHVLEDARSPRDLVRAVGPAPPKGARAKPRPVVRSQPARRPQEVRTLTESLDWHAEAHPDRLHVRILDDEEGSEVTYGALRHEARAVAAGLLERGVSPGESVALMLPTSREYFVTFFGILLAGAIAVPLYPPVRPALIEEHLRRQSAILQNARATVLVSPPEARALSRLVRSHVESLRSVLTPDQLPASYDTALPVAQPRDIALLQYTSGSTGNPKGVVLTHHHLLANIEAMIRATAVEPEDVFVSWLPLYHDMGLIGAWLGSLHVGMPLVSMSPLSFLLRPARWLQAISDHKATLTGAPNFAFELCLRTVGDEERDPLDLSSLRLVFDGAEAVNPETVRRFTEAFASCGLRPETVLPVYGLAEAAVGLAFPPVGREPVFDRIVRSRFLQSGRARPVGEHETDENDVIEFAACGLPLPGYEVRIVDDADREKADRTEGHIQFRGPSATSGYFRNPEATRRLFHGDWLDTGDLGYVADGDLYVTGRLKDLIIRAGRNLHPEEMEQVVGQVPGVRKGCVAVFGTPDPTAGTERLVVVAETRETDRAELEEIRRRVVGGVVDLLGSAPDEVVLVPPGTVPKTSSGKIRRTETRARYEKGELRPERRGLLRQLASFALSGFSTRLRRLRRAVADSAYAVLGWAMLVGIGLPLAFVLALTPTIRLRWAALRAAARSALVVSRVPVRVHGASSLPAGPYITVSNHASWADGIALAATMPGRLRFVAGEVFARQPVIGYVLRRGGTVFVERGDREHSVADAARLVTLAKGEEHLTIFPEGGLAPLPGLRQFHLGAFTAAASAGVPVVPVAIRGSRRVIRPGGKVLRRGTIDVVIGQALSAGGADWHDAVALQEAAREQILRHCGEPDLA
jgi:acyl carrier protein